jgi:Putative addiction module component
MNTHFEDIEIQARALPLKQKAALARLLIEELDSSFDPNAEQLWIDEAQRRYDAYLKGQIEALPGDDVMARARNRITPRREGISLTGRG